MKHIATFVLCTACVLVAFGKPAMNVKKLSSTAKFTGRSSGSITTTHFVSGLYAGTEVDDSGWLKEVKSAQTYQFCISASPEDINKVFILNIVTIVKSRKAKGGYGYSKTSSFKMSFSRSGANEGALKMTFITPQFNGRRDKSGFGEDLSDGWVVNGIAAELVDEEGNILRTWSNCSLAQKFSNGLTSFFQDPPRTMSSDAIYESKEAGAVADIAEYISLEQIEHP